MSERDDGHRTDNDPRLDRGRGTEVGRLARLGDLDQYTVAEAEPDVRGWQVLTREAAAAGTVADLVVDLLAMRVCYLDVQLDKDALRLRRARHVLVPIGTAWLNEDEKVVGLGVTAAELIAAPAYDPRSFSDAHEEVLRQRYAGVLTRSDDELAVARRQRMAGNVGARKRAATEDVEKSVPVTREEEVVAEKRAVPEEGGSKEASGA